MKTSHLIRMQAHETGVTVPELRTVGVVDQMVIDVENIFGNERPLIPPEGLPAPRGGFS